MHILVCLYYRINSALVDKEIIVNCRTTNERALMVKMQKNMKRVLIRTVEHTYVHIQLVIDEGFYYQQTSQSLIAFWSFFNLKNYLDR